VGADVAAAVDVTPTSLAASSGATRPLSGRHGASGGDGSGGGSSGGSGGGAGSAVGPVDASAEVLPLRRRVAELEQALAAAETRADGFRQQWQTLADRAFAQMDALEQMDGVKVCDAAGDTVRVLCAVFSVCVCVLSSLLCCVMLCCVVLCCIVSCCVVHEAALHWWMGRHCDFIAPESRVAVRA
jgi:hypothetical protein